MNNEVKNRIALFLEAKQISVSSLVRMSGLPQPTLQKQIKGESAVSCKLIVSVCELFPELSAEWLIRGEGNMYKTTNVINVFKQGGNGDNQTNVAGDGNEMSDKEALKLALQQNQKLIDMLMKDK